MNIAHLEARLRTLLLLTSLVLSISALVPASVLAADGKPVLLYSRYFNAEGETRYLPDGTYKDVLGRLGETFEVRVSAEPLNEATLAGVAVVLIANPNDKAVEGHPEPHHCTPADVSALLRFVEEGGGLIALANQENHNVESEDFNTLLQLMGMKWVDLYTDTKSLLIPAEVPVIGGLRWAYYSGNSITIRRDHPAAQVKIVVENDLAQKLAKGTRDVAGVLLAGSERGKGRAVSITDAGCISNDALSGKGIGGVSITEQDNWEIFRRLARWAAHLE